MNCIAITRFLTDFSRGIVRARNKATNEMRRAGEGNDGDACSEAAVDLLHVLGQPRAVAHIHEGVGDWVVYPARSRGG